MTAVDRHELTEPQCDTSERGPKLTDADIEGTHMGTRGEQVDVKCGLAALLDLFDGELRVRERGDPGIRKSGVAIDAIVLSSDRNVLQQRVRRQDGLRIPKPPFVEAGVVITHE